MSISIFSLTGFAVEMWWKYQFMGHQFFVQDWWNIAKVVVIMLASLENLIGMLPFWSAQALLCFTH